MLLREAVDSRNRQPQVEGSHSVENQSPRVAMLLGSQGTNPDLSVSRASGYLSTSWVRAGPWGQLRGSWGLGIGVWGTLDASGCPYRTCPGGQTLSPSG